MMQQARLLSGLLVVVVVLLGQFLAVLAIDCYKCTSINGASKDCEDEFDVGMATVHLIQRDCFYGHFRGTHCMKLKGERDDGTQITVRDCSDSDWGSHCGDIRYQCEGEEHMITGCLEGCNHDGCNRAHTHAPSMLLLVLLPLLTLLTSWTKYLTANHQCPE